MIAAVVLSPLGLVALRAGASGHGRERGRREAALALYRAQLAELERDRAEGRLDEASHASARLEVQRRLLAADLVESGPAPSPAPSRGVNRRWPVLAALGLIPVAALILYAIEGHPELPSLSREERTAEAAQQAQQMDKLIQRLRQNLASMATDKPERRDGYVLLGNAEAARGNLNAAVDAWRRALDIGFDPTLAAQTAEAITRSTGHWTEESRLLFTRALAQAPPFASWRSLAEQRLAESPASTPSASAPTTQGNQDR